MHKLMMIICALVLGSLLPTYTALANGPTFVYVESNIKTPNGNSIFAFRRDADGSLTPVNGSPFLTGGAGVQDQLDQARVHGLDKCSKRLPK